MLPTINGFVSKYGLENFVVVADSGLMNNANIAELEAHGYKYIIGAKIKNESQEVKNWILEQPLNKDPSLNNHQTFLPLFPSQ